MTGVQLVQPTAAETPQPPELRRQSSLVDDAYRRLKALILDNSIASGTTAFELDLARDLQMSRTPVREALVKLQGEGLVEILPRRGVRIRSISADDMREIYQVLGALEPMAARLLAERRLPKSDPILATLDRATKDMAEALREQNLERWADADASFHATLLHECGNERLARTAFGFWDQSHRARVATLRFRPPPIDSTQEHKAVADAIRRHDAESAFALHAAHRQRGMTVMLAAIKNYRLRFL